MFTATNLGGSVHEFRFLSEKQPSPKHCADGSIVLACLVFIVGVVCVISITQMLGSPDLPDADTAVNHPVCPTQKAPFLPLPRRRGKPGKPDSHGRGIGTSQCQYPGTKQFPGRRPSSSATNTTSQSYTTSRHQTWYDDEEGEEYHTSSRTGSTTSREEEYTSSHTSQPTTSQEEPTTSTPEEPTTSTPEEPTSTPSVPSTSTPSSSTSTPATSTPEEPDLPADGTVTE